MGISKLTACISFKINPEAVTLSYIGEIVTSLYVSPGSQQTTLLKVFYDILIFYESAKCNTIHGVLHRDTPMCACLIILAMVARGPVGVGP